MESKNPVVINSFRNQLKWFQEVGSFVGEYPPKFIRNNTKDGASHSYDIAYINPKKFSKLDDVLLSNDISKEMIDTITNEIIKFQNKIYTKGCSYSFDEQMKLAWFAINETKKLCRNIDFNKNITINQKETIESPNSLFKKLKDKKYYQFLQPNKIHYLHGDLHPGNMFFDKAANQLKIIDPVAPLGLYFGDISFDFAKMDSYFSGALYQLRKGLFDIKIAKESDIFIDYKLKKDKAFDQFFDKQYEKTMEKIKTNLESNWLRNDENYKTRKYFCDFLYYFTMAPVVKPPQNQMRLALAIESLDTFLKKVDNTL